MPQPRILLLLTALFALLVGCTDRVPRLTGELTRTEPYPSALLGAVAALPVQHQGRVMPLSTFAAFTLYEVHGRRDVQFVAADGRGGDRRAKLSQPEWLLDVWCFPDQAQHYPLFRIENVGVFDALGFHHDGQKQGFEYLTYAQLFERGQKLQELASSYRQKPTAMRSEVEEHLVGLFGKLVNYNRLHRLVEAFQYEFALRGEKLQQTLGGRDRIGVATLVREAEAFRTYVRAVGEQFEAPEHGNLADLLSFLSTAAQDTSGPAMLPPVGGEAKTPWLTLGEAIDRAVRGKGAVEHVGMLEHLQAALVATDMPARERHWRSFQGGVSGLAAQRGESQTVDLEVYYYGANWHFHAMMTFVLGFLIAVVCWALPRNRLLWGASMIVSAAALTMLIADIWLRCVITGHPPIARLYDTFLFIGGVAALTLLIAEWIVPRRIALALAPFLGALLILLARAFEVLDGQDTMRPLVAVLLSNFWLAVHVPTINIGYAAGVAAAMVANAWILVRVFRIAAPGENLPKSLVRMAYGVTCFSLATSVVGTILGGVWANDSWGRFWGWDPKENGALLICLSQIALLHARMSGMVRDAGFVLWTAATGMIVVFSWFHTNLLQVGLHSYGFSPALRDAVWWSYLGQTALLVVAAFDILARPNPKPAERTTVAPTELA
jgi:ABC-type transport system involved in cytochrome c biogenesis permease subunit